MTEPSNTHPAISWDYTQAPPTGDVADIIGLLNSTPAVLGILGDYWSDNVLTLKLYENRISAPNGAFVVQTGMTQKAVAISDTPFSSVAPGAAFPLAQTGEVTPVVGNTIKLAAKTVVTYEDVLAYRRSAVDTAARQLSNDFSDDSDANAVSTLVTAIPATGGSARAVAASATFVAATSADQILAPLMLARSTIRNARLGFNPRTLVLSETNGALLASSAPVQTLLALSRGETTVTSDGLGSIAGFEIVTVPDDLCASNALATGGFLCDAKLLGGIAEQIPLRGQSIFNGPNLSPAEAWIVSLAWNFAPYVQNPLAGCWITGVSS